MISFIGLSIIFGMLFCIGIFALYTCILLAEYFAIAIMAKITMQTNTPETIKAFQSVSKR